MSIAEKLARAISLAESGGRQVFGASGEFGSFQFMPATWQAISAKYNRTINNVNAPIEQTDENEWKVAVWKIGSLLDKGFTPEEVALIWNTSLGGVEKPRRIAGINRRGVRYDSQAYANKVIRFFEKIV